MMRKTKLSVIGLALFVLLFAFAACGGGEDKGEAVGAVKVTLEYPEGDNVTGEASIYEGDSYLDCTQTFCRDQNIPIVVEGASYVTVNSINNIASGDYGDTYGWIYLVNGEMIMESASEISAVDGAEVTWRYADMNNMSVE